MCKRLVAVASVLLVSLAAGAKKPTVAAPSTAAPAIPASSGVVVISPAELHAFDTVWAISDIHGRLDRMTTLLEAAKLAVPGAGGKGLQWNPAAHRQLLIVTGDYIDGGPDSAGVLQAFHALQQGAPGAQSRVVALLGNHEVELLDNPDKVASKELLKSAQAKSGHEVMASPLGAFIRAMPACAIVGTWLFAHAGFIDAKDDAGKLVAFFHDLGQKRTKDLLAKKSIIAYHHWWDDKSNVKEMRTRLDLLGLSGLVFGHDPEALKAEGDIAIKDGWLIKLDTGLKEEESKGEMLRCPAAAMAAHGPSQCMSLHHGGDVKALPAK